MENISPVGENAAQKNRRPNLIVLETAYIIEEGCIHTLKKCNFVGIRDKGENQERRPQMQSQLGKSINRKTH
jgi:hypothetical protein